MTSQLESALMTLDFDEAPGESSAADRDLPKDASSSVVEMLLKDRLSLDQLLRDPARQRQLIPKLLAIALAGFASYGFVATLVLNAIYSRSGYWPELVPHSFWNRSSAGNLTLAYCLGLIAAN